MANVTITTAANWIPQVWSKEITEFRQAALVYLPLVNHIYENDIGKGDRVHIADLPETAARTLTNMTGALTEDGITLTTQALTVNTLAYIFHIVDKATRVQSHIDAVEKLTRAAGYGVAKKEDTDGLALVDTLTTNTVGTMAVPITEPDIIRAGRLLDDSNVPAERFGVVSPYCMEDIRSIETLRNRLYQETSGSVKIAGGNGYIGTMLGIRWYQTTQVEGDNSAGHDNLIAYKENVAVVTQKDVSVERTDMLAGKELAVGFISWVMYGWKVIRDGDGVWVKGH